MTAPMTLTEYLGTWPRAWSWADAHCGTFVCEWIGHATGRSILARLPAADTPLGWVRAVQQAGGMHAFASAVLGCESVPAGEAGLGDILLYRGRVTGGAMGIALSAGGAALSESGRVVVLPRSQALAAWPVVRVGRRA